MKYTFR